MSPRPGWADTTLGELQRRTSSLDPRTAPDQPFELYSVPSYSSLIPEQIAGAEIGSAKQIVEANDVLLCKIVPHIRRAWVVPRSSEKPQIGSGEWLVFRNPAVEPSYLKLFLLSDGFHEQFMRTVSGVGGSLMRARPSEAGKISVPLPPLAEQRRIAAKLDAITDRLARAREEAHTSIALAARLRAEVVETALEGALFDGLEQWLDADISELERRRALYLRARRGSRLHSIDETLISRLRGKRRTWLDCRLSDVIDLRVGYAFKSADFVPSGGVPLVRGANVAPGRIDWTQKASLRAEVALSFDRYRLCEGDIVIAMDRPIISSGVKVAVVQTESAGALLVQRVANPQPTRFIDADFLLILLTSRYFIDQIQRHATGSDLPHISGNDILTTPCPLPPMTVQKEVVRLVQQTLQRADRLELEAKKALALIDRLEAAILAKAFRGELVAQDPNDEPASVLLERIRARRAAEPKAKRGRRPKLAS